MPKSEKEIMIRVQFQASQQNAYSVKFCSVGLFMCVSEGEQEQIHVHPFCLTKNILTEVKTKPTFLTEDDPRP